MESSAPNRLLLLNPSVKLWETQRIHAHHLSLHDRLACLRASVSFHMCLCGVMLPGPWRGIPPVWLTFEVVSAAFGGEFNKARSLSSSPSSPLPLINVWNERSRVSCGGHSGWTKSKACGSVIRSPSGHSAASPKNPKSRLSCHRGFTVLYQDTPAAVPAGGSRFQFALTELEPDPWVMAQRRA